MTHHRTQTERGHTLHSHHRRHNPATSTKITNSGAARVQDQIRQTDGQFTQGKRSASWEPSADRGERRWGGTFGKQVGTSQVSVITATKGTATWAAASTQISTRSDDTDTERARELATDIADGYSAMLGDHHRPPLGPDARRP